MIICFASKDGLHVDEHFGWCQHFYMYELSEVGFHFIKVIDSTKKIDQEVDKLLYKIESLEDSQIVCITQIGPKASSMVQAAGIYPLRAKEDSLIEDILTSLQNQLKNNPPLWLKRISLKA